MIRSGDEMLGLMVHGHITAQYMDGRTFTELGPMAVRVLVCALALLGSLLGWIFWEQRLDLTGRSTATVVLVMIDGLVYSQLRIILTAWLIGVTSGHHLRSLVTWASSASASTDT